ncbi:MAG: pimeloyl-[acyl-carrier protein] methyl ester esterase [Alteromonadaceae bacterium]|jgi:pimeloyl-[acyl-carrier protein] methyl ester esterase
MAETLQITSQGQGLTLVFIHGWGLNSAVWQPTIAQLSTQFEVITIDLPGFGLNVDNIISPYSLPSVVQEIQQAINKPAIYIGWSLGGLIATEISLRYPEKVLGLVTIASSPCFTKQLTWLGIAPEMLTLFHHQLAEDTKKTIEGFLKIQAMGSPHIRQDIKVIRDLIMQYPMASRQTLDDSLRLLETVDKRAQLSLITQPFLRMYGKLDGLVPKKVIPMINDLSPNSDFYIFEKSSHAPFISHLDEFVITLTAWLSAKF